MNATKNNLLTTFKAQVAADKKKSAILGILCCVLIVVVAKQFLGGNTSTVETPATAVAAPMVPAAPSPKITATPVDPTNLAPAPKASVSTTETPANKPPPIKTVYVDEIARDLARDLFTLKSWTTYAHTFATEAANHTKRRESPDFWSRFVKAADEYQESRREEAKTIAKDLAELRLQSTLTGSNPSAYISGRLVHETDQLLGFTVSRIDDRRVILTKSGYSYVLQMP
jgi:hypothetical protein